MTSYSTRLLRPTSMCSFLFSCNCSLFTRQTCVNYVQHEMNFSVFLNHSLCQPTLLLDLPRPVSRVPVSIGVDSTTLLVAVPRQLTGIIVCSNDFLVLKLGRRPCDMAMRDHNAVHKASVTWQGPSMRVCEELREDVWRDGTHEMSMWGIEGRGWL